MSYKQISRGEIKPIPRNKINQTNITILHDWIENTKCHLLTTEETNIRIRCRGLESLINEETANINAQIFPAKPSKSEEITFEYKVANDKIKEYLSYIHKWKGLRYSAKIPKTEKEYLEKARNWLNGRRQKVYRDTLFADMIYSAIKFAQTLVIKRYSETDDTNIEILKDLYRQALISSYLVRICSKRISLNKSSKQSYLISEYSIKSKCKTKQLLQQNSKNTRSNFPSHRREAIDLFQKQYQMEINSINRLSGKDKSTKKLRSGTKIVGNNMVQKLLNGDNINISSNDYNVVYIEPQSLIKIFNFINNLHHESVKSRHSICKLKEKINHLEHNLSATGFISKNSTHNACSAATDNCYQSNKSKEFTNGLSDGEDYEMLNNYYDSEMEMYAPISPNIWSQPSNSMINSIRL